MVIDKSKTKHSSDVLLIPLDETWDTNEKDSINHVLPMREKEFSRNWAEDGNAFLMQMLQKLCFAKEEWVFIFHGRFSSLTTLVHEIEMCIHASTFDAALFDEKLEGGIELHYPDSDENLVAGLLENLPSHLLLRRRVLLELLEQRKDILYPKVLQKLLHAAKHNGIRIVCTHQMLDRELPCDRLSLIPFSATNMFYGYQGKRILIITHELSRTGAPIVLFEMCVSILKKKGYKMVVLSPSKGPIGEEFIANGIPVVILPKLLYRWPDHIIGMAMCYDLVLVNTIVPYETIRMLSAITVPVLWWIHDCELGYQYTEPYLPQNIGENVHVSCGGQYALDVLRKYRPSFGGDVLLYSIKDRNPEGKTFQSKSKEKLLFSCIASVEQRKGQDVLAEAILQLESEILDQCEFMFVGNVNDPIIYKSIEKVVRQLPEHVAYWKNIPREKLDEVYQQTDCIICSSRDDPMPAFVTEGMMFGKPVICSQYTGTAALIEGTEAGILYHGNASSELAECIRKFVSLDSKEREKKGKAARRLYEDNFSIAAVEDRFLAKLNSLMDIGKY